MQISNYTIKQKIGEGGMATVYLAEHNTLAQSVAIKILNKDLVHNENIQKRFLSEGKNMFKMSHPNIIKVSDLIDQDDVVAIVMEYIEGETLKDYLDRKGKLPASEIKSMLNQMLDAIEYVHERALVHRDIKPSNFMLSKNGEVKLLDFGIAKNIDKTSSDYTQTGTMQSMGTPMYMSPEQIKSTRDVTGQSDIYSLGVVLWQMSMGFRPYDTNTTSSFELQTKIVTEPLPPTNTEFDSVIQKATAKNVEDRFKNCKEIKEALLSTSKKKSIDTDKTVIINTSDKTKVEFKDSPKTEIYTNASVNPTLNKSKNRLPIIALVSALVLIIGFFIYRSFSYKTETDYLGNVIYDKAGLLPAPNFNEPNKIDSDSTKYVSLNLITKNDTMEFASWVSNFLNNIPEELDEKLIPDNIKYQYLIGNYKIVKGLTYPKYNIYFQGKVDSNEINHKLIITNLESNVNKHVLDFSKFILSPEHKKTENEIDLHSIEYAEIKNDILYVSHFNDDNAVGVESPNNAYISAIDLKDYSIIWTSPPLVCNSFNFTFYDNFVVTGYGDNVNGYINFLDLKTGNHSFPVKIVGQPIYLIFKENKLHVYTSNKMSYIFEVVKKYQN